MFLNASISMLDEKPEVVEKDRTRSTSGASRGEVEFEDVGFAYKGRVDTLKNISFKVPRPAQRVAVVGPTGAGKTTLVSLLVRFYDPASGVITIDGIDIRDLTLDCLRDQLSLVLQEPMLFSGTIADNIRYGGSTRPWTTSSTAAKGANCHDFIARLAATATRPSSARAARSSPAASASASASRARSSATRRS